MKKINKVKTIINAFTEKLPIGEPWYEERLSICSGCDYNTDNINSRGVLGFVKDLMGASCTACGCFIAEKASRKEESCGLVDKGLTPKWKNLAVITADKDDWNIYNNNPEKATIDLSEDGTHYFLFYNDITDSSNTNIELILEGNHDIKNIGVSCGCTVPSYIKMAEGLWKVNIKLNPKKVHKGNFLKAVYIEYGNKKVVIKLKGVKK